MRIRTLTAAGAWALGDQALSSATNFAAAIVVARTVGPAGYGSFTLAFGSWVVLLGATRAMLIQPYTVAVSGVSVHEWRMATRSTAAAVSIFGVVFGLAAVVAGVVLGATAPTGSAFVALGFFAGPLALQDFWRFAAFSQGSPRTATFNDGVWAVVQAVALAATVAAHSLTPATAVASWGLGALAGALYGLRQFRVRPSLGVSERRFIRQNAALGGWYGVSNASHTAGAYGATLLIGAGAGPAGLGGFGSADNLLAPARLVAASSDSILLPIAARVAKEESPEALRKLCRTYSIAVAGFFSLAGAVLVLAGPIALRTLFGTEYLRFSPLLPPLVATTIITGLATGLFLGFRALGEGRRLAWLQTASSAAKLAIVAASLPFGLVAIAWGIAAAEVLRTALAWATFEKALSRRRGEWRAGVGPIDTIPTGVLS